DPRLPRRQGIVRLVGDVSHGSTGRYRSESAGLQRDDDQDRARRGRHARAERHRLRPRSARRHRDRRLGGRGRRRGHRRGAEAEESRPVMRTTLTAAAAALVLSVPALVAQSGRPLTIRDLLVTVRVSDPRLSPDGRTVAYVRTTTDLATGR